MKIVDVPVGDLCGVVNTCACFSKFDFCFL